MYIYPPIDNSTHKLDIKQLNFISKSTVTNSSDLTDYIQKIMPYNSVQIIFRKNFISGINNTGEIIMLWIQQKQT